MSLRYEREVIEANAGTAAGATTLVVMGVTGSGKSTVARRLVERLGWRFAEGDDFHPPANVAKMHSGHPLDDDDRWPWLRSIAGWIGEREAAGQDAIVACSALKRSYRDMLGKGHPSVWFVLVDVPAEALAQRLADRADHFMPPSLLQSQLATLEPLAPDEPGVAVRGDGAPDEVARDVLHALRAHRQ